MKQSQLFTKTIKDISEDELSINAQLLQRGAFVDKLMAGVYTFLPLGYRVLNKIENVIRKHMDTLGPEMLMPSLCPKENWQTTGRFDTLDILFSTQGANKASKDKNSSEYVLNPTHEDVITPLVQKFSLSYKDLPFATYQIQTKFRNEARPKSGLLRGREFRMKDLYSFGKNEQEFNDFYEKAKEVYVDIFKDLGIGDSTYITIASGGDFTKKYSHEFQTECETGEDDVYLCEKCKLGINREVIEKQKTCVKCGNSKLKAIKTSEVGNIFPLETRFSDAFNYTYTDKDGSQKKVYMGSYGIGPSRVMGVLVEKFHDNKGIIWPEQVAPFTVHLISLNKNKETEKIYNQLISEGIEVLYDDRDLRPGEKFVEADLIGCPYRVVVSQKTLDNKGVEVKRRDKSKEEIMTIKKLITKIKKK